MITEIFEFYYTTNMHPARLKPLSREELSEGMSADAVEKYLSLVEQLYNVCAFDVNAEFVPIPAEIRREEAMKCERIYDDLIKHLFKQDAISDSAFFELHKAMPIDFDFIEHPSIPGKYVSDSLDDFRLAFERGLVESDEYTNMTNSYLEDRYRFSVCVRPNTPSKEYVLDSDLMIIRYEGIVTDVSTVEASYWEVKQLLKTIQQDMKHNKEEQRRLDSQFSKQKNPQLSYMSSLEKSTYPKPQNVGEWYTIKRALEVEAGMLCGVEDEIERIFDTMEKPSDSAGSGAILFIYKGSIRCHQQKHHIVPATAILCDAMDRDVEVDVEYCPECNRYLLSHISYEQSRERYGLLIGKLKMISSSGNGADFELASEGPLKLCGYNVSQDEGLSASTRQYLLAKIIHDGIMSKLDVIHYLERFINMNGAKKENIMALEKWCDDLDFVHKYNKSIQPKVYITTVKKY